MYLQRLFNCRFNVILLRRLCEHDIDGEGAAGDLEHGHAAEKISEFGGVERGGCDDEFEIVAAGNDLAQDAEQDVGVEGALVGLVHDDARVSVKIAFLQRLAQQDAVCHVFNQSFFAVLVGLVLEADGISHLLPHFTQHLFRNSLGDSDGGDSAGLPCISEVFV